MEDEPESQSFRKREIDFLKKLVKETKKGKDFPIFPQGKLMDNTNYWFQWIIKYQWGMISIGRTKDSYVLTSLGSRMGKTHIIKTSGKIDLKKLRKIIFSVKDELEGRSISGLI